MGFFHTEIDIPLTLIGIAFFNQVFHKTDDIRHKLDYTRMTSRRLNTKSRHVFTKCSDILVRYFLRRDAFFFGTVDNLIIHIGKVGNIGNLIATVFEIATNGIEGYCRTSIPHVDIVVYSWPTDIHLNLTVLDWDKFSQITRHGVIDFNHSLTPFCFLFIVKSSFNPALWQLLRLSQRKS